MADTLQVFFFIFKLVEILEWDALPDDFKEKASFSVDFSALNSKFNILPTILVMLMLFQRRTTHN